MITPEERDAVERICKNLRVLEGIREKRDAAQQELDEFRQKRDALRDAYDSAVAEIDADMVTLRGLS